MPKVKVQALTSTAGNYGFKTPADAPFEMEEADAKKLADAGTVKITGKVSAADEKKAVEDKVNITDNTQPAQPPFQEAQKASSKGGSTVNVTPAKKSGRKGSKK